MRRDWGLLAALAVTGLAALAIEVLWSRAMIPWVGGTALSQITTVAIYMVGLFLGSAAAARRVERIADPRRDFFRIEIAAAGVSLAAVLGMPLADPLFALFSRGELLGNALGSVLRGLTGAALILPATILMGWSFPLAIAAFERSQGGRGNAALAYGVNTIGATLGTLAGGFVLVPRLGVVAGTLVIVAADVALLLALMRTRPPAAYARGAAAPAPAAAHAGTPPADPAEWPMLLSIFAGGMVSLGLQAVLFRVLGLLLGPTARAFTVVLAVYVGGLGIGSLAVKRLVERGERSASAIYLACWLVVGVWGLAISTQVEALTGVVARSQSGEGFDLAAQLGLRTWISILVLLPLTAAFGASYSAAVAAAPRTGAARASRLYASLTLGNIVGLGVVAWGVLPNLRLDHALVLVLAAALVTPLPALAALPIARGARVLAGVGGVAAAVAAWWLVPGWPLRVMHTAAYVPAYADAGAAGDRQVVRFHRSAFETSVTVIQVGEDRFLQLDGKATGSTDVADQATQGLLGAIPAVLHPAPRSAFVIGLGTGQTAAEILRHPVERVDCAEISPEVIDTLPLFAALNRRCDLDPRFRMLEADGRTVLRYGGARYDLVVSEPSNVWIPGVAHLFTAESFRDARDCLEPERGLCVQWMQGYGLEIDTLRTIVRTFLDAFPHASLWFSSLGQADVFLVGAQQPLELDWDALEARLAGVAVPNVNAGGAPFDAVSLLRHFVAGPEALRRFAGDGPRTTDARPSLEYAAEAALIGSGGDAGGSLLALLVEPPFELLAGRGAALPAQTRARLIERAEANRIAARELDDATRASALVGEAGVALCERLVARFPDDLELRWTIVSNLMFGLSSELARGDQERLLALMSRVARLAPDHPESLKLEAIRRLQERDLDGALALAARQAAATPAWQQRPKVDRAGYLAALGRNDEAIALLEEVVAADPWYLTAWRQLEAVARAHAAVAVAERAAARIAELTDDGASRAAQRRLAAEMESLGRETERAVRVP